MLSDIGCPIGQKRMISDSELLEPQKTDNQTQIFYVFLNFWGYYDIPGVCALSVYAGLGLVTISQVVGYKTSSTWSSIPKDSPLLPKEAFKKEYEKRSDPLYPVLKIACYLRRTGRPSTWLSTRRGPTIGRTTVAMNPPNGGSYIERSKTAKTI